MKRLAYLARAGWRDRFQSAHGERYAVSGMARPPDPAPQLRAIFTQRLQGRAKSLENLYAFLDTLHPFDYASRTDST
ncbi:MAG TPA: hypothetical protein VIT92_14615 [Burkholderiaceae bacterium]